MTAKKVKVLDEHGNTIREGLPRNNDVLGNSNDFRNGLILLCIASIFGSIAWGGGQILTDVRENVIDIKTTQDKMWVFISKDDSKINCMQNQMAKCCKDSNYCV